MKYVDHIVVEMVKCNFPGCEKWETTESLKIAIENGTILAFCIIHSKELALEGVPLRALTNVIKEFDGEKSLQEEPKIRASTFMKSKTSKTPSGENIDWHGGSIKNLSM